MDFSNEDKWKPISSIENIPDNITTIHVDTRDWHAVLVSNEIDWNRQDSNVDLKKIHDAVRFTKDERFQISSENLLALLKSLKEWTGGDADWRMFNLKGVETKSGWFKYIRCYRVPETNQWVMTDGFRAIRVSAFTEDNIDKEHLNVCD